LAVYPAFGRKGRILVLVFVLSTLMFPVPVQAESSTRPPRTVYHSKSAVIQMYKDLCDAHPKYTSYEVIGQSYLGRDIYLFKIGNPEGGRVMIDGATHGTEDAGTEISYLFMKWILESDEEEAYKVLHGNYFLVIPIINMDNYGINRQNARTRYETWESPTGQAIDCPYGIDLNRNGVTGWGQSGSGDPYDDYQYRGAWAGSEPETQAYRNAMNRYRPDIYVNAHFGGEYMLNRDPSEKRGMSEKVLVLYDENRAERGVTYRYSLVGGLRGGFVANDGWGFGASGWLVEFAKWENVPAEYDTFVSEWYPKAFPLYLAWCQAVQIDVRTHISISLTSSTSYVGFKVEINGNLTCNKVGVPGAPVLLSYSVNGGEPWNNITFVSTAYDGGYSAEWMPSATGNYLVKATWSGNDTYPGATTIVNLAVIPFEGQNVFSVESNSSISELAFNATSWTLSFTASGPHGTRGYVKVTVAKSLVANITNIRVFLDGIRSEYSIASLDDSWLLTFDYIHSTHQVEVNLGTPMEVDTTPPIVSILYPENKTYTVEDVPLTFTVSESTALMGYSLDGQMNVTISGNTTMVDLSEGTHTITVYANDTAGNMGYSDTVYFTVDTVSPNIETLSPENKTYTTSSVPLSFTVDEATSWIGYSLDEQANITIAGNKTLTGLSDGMHSLVVYASDIAGNVGYSDIVYFTIQTTPIDTTPPSISIVSPENKTYDTTNIPLTFTADESVSWMAYSLDNNANVTITGNTTLSGLSDGSHSLVVNAKDTAGNTGASETVYFSIETQKAEPFPTWIVAPIVIIAVVGAALLVYFAKVKKTTEKVKW